MSENNANIFSFFKKEKSGSSNNAIKGRVIGGIFWMNLTSHNNYSLRIFLTSIVSNS
jgi:hypothetical protein